MADKQAHLFRFKLGAAAWGKCEAGRTFFDKKKKPSFSSLTGLKVKPELFTAGSLLSPTACHKMTPGETLMSEEMGWWHHITFVKYSYLLGL